VSSVGRLQGEKEDYSSRNKVVANDKEDAGEGDDQRTVLSTQQKIARDARSPAEIYKLRKAGVTSRCPVNRNRKSIRGQTGARVQDWAGDRGSPRKKRVPWHQIRRKTTMGKGMSSKRPEPALGAPPPGLESGVRGTDDGGNSHGSQSPNRESCSRPRST